MKKTSQNKTKLNSKYEGMALFEIEKDLLNVSEVKSPKLDLGSLEKDYKELALRHYSNFNQQTTEFLYKAYLQIWRIHEIVRGHTFKDRPKN